MAENIRGFSPCRIRGFLLLCLFFTTVAKRYRKYQAPEGNWGEWGACSGTCGEGQRTRTGCKKELNWYKKKCPNGQETKETEDCSMFFTCSSTSFNVQGSSPAPKTSSIARSPEKITRSLTSFVVPLPMPMMTLSKTASLTQLILTSRLREMTSSVEITSPPSFLVGTSLALMMTSSLTPLLPTSISKHMTPSVKINSQLSLLVITSSGAMMTSSKAASSTQMILAISSGGITSSAKIIPQLSSLVVASLAPMMTSSVATSTLIPTSSSREMTSSVEINRDFSSSVFASSAPMMTSSIALTPLIPTSSSREMTLSVETTAQFSLLKVTSSSPTPFIPVSNSREMTSSAPMLTSRSVSEIQSSSSKPAYQVTQKPSENIDNQEDLTSLQGYFTVEKDRVLLNHVVEEIWTSSQMTCAMFCLRHPKCQSFNFKSTPEFPNQQQNAMPGEFRNCELNAAKHLANKKDFILSQGYWYFQVIY